MYYFPSLATNNADKLAFDLFLSDKELVCKIISYYSADQIQDSSICYMYYRSSLSYTNTSFSYLKIAELEH